MCHMWASVPVATSSRGKIVSRDKYQVWSSCSQTLLTYTLLGWGEPRERGHGTTGDMLMSGMSARLKSVVTWLPATSAN